MTLLPYDFRNSQKLRTDAQPVLPGRLQVDLNAHSSVFKAEVDHAAFARKVVALPHREHAGILDSLKDGGQAFSLRRAYKSDVAPAHLFRVRRLTHRERLAIHRLAADRPLQRAVERIFADNADRDWIAGALERLRRPRHEFREVEEKRRFHAVFFGGLPPRDGGQPDGEYQRRHFRAHLWQRSTYWVRSARDLNVLALSFRPSRAISGFVNRLPLWLGAALVCALHSSAQSSQDLNSLTLEELMQVKVEGAALHSQTLEDAPASVT